MDVDAGSDAGEEIPPFEAYHLLETEVAVSLGLDRVGGTFRHQVNLCSILASGDGRMVEMGEAVTLLPSEGSSGFLWYSAMSSDRMVAEVNLRPDPRGYIASFDVEGETIEETWLTGGLCPNCDPMVRGTMRCENPFGP